MERHVVAGSIKPWRQIERNTVMMLPLSRLAAATLLGLGSYANAQTREPVETLCRCAETCLAESGKLLGRPAGGGTSELARTQDMFYWFGRINMASTVANVERGIIAPELAGPIARGVAHSINQGAMPGGKRPNDVLQTEKIITDFAGPDATLIHTGRSRQDMHPTLTMGQLRVELLDFTDRLAELRAQLLEMAGQNVETFVPAYTNGVQAMPTSYGQYLLAFADSFARDAERIRQAWARVDRSPPRQRGAGQLELAAGPCPPGRPARLRGTGHQRL